MPDSDAGARPLRGRNALVTGGTRSVGAATTRRLAELGADVIATYRSDADGAATFAADVARETGGNVITRPFDMSAAVGETESVESLLAGVQQRGIELDALIVCAAAPHPQVALRDLDTDALTTKLTSDLGATHRLLTAVLPRMAERGFGRVVVVGSMHSLGPTAPGMAANGVTKAAVASYVNYAVDELTGPGVTVNLVEPGFVATDASSHVPDSIRSAISTLTPSGRTGEPADIAAAIGWLVQDDAGFVNGARIPVTGGMNGPVPIARVLAVNRDG